MTKKELKQLSPGDLVCMSHDREAPLYRFRRMFNGDVVVRSEDDDQEYIVPLRRVKGLTIGQLKDHMARQREL